MRLYARQGIAGGEEEELIVEREGLV